ncbi:MAG: isoleucine--tRNA ligase [Candidatus Shikimatogenerans sp. JK-2022]|nr:isoleucine--tRNA ligase [Candidatus Shikimatogenerans bostrichidophilus]
MNKQLNFYKIYKKIFYLWKKEDKIKYIKKKKRKFIIYDGPPSMNGEPGIHHITSRIIKDIFYRFYTMKNYEVINKLGWDTHGLPIELLVEKKLKINKKDIGKKISIKYFNKKCKQIIKKNLKKWIKFTNLIGYNFYKKNYFITYKSNYIESTWWILKKIYKKKLLYKKYKVLPYSPMAGTSISYQELNFPNTKKKIKVFSIYVLFKLKINFFLNKYYKKIYLLVWTTTPWTLPSNTALLINKKLYYLLIRVNKINLILSENSIKYIFKNNKNYKILKKFLGKELLNKKYYQLLKWFKPLKKKKKFIIINDTLNIIKDNLGTGIIHISPTFGKEDYEISKINNISSIYYINKNNKKIPIVNKYGKFINNVPFNLGGKYIKEEYYNKNDKNKISVDKIIIKILKKKKKIFKIRKYKYKYNYCWRTNKPIIYYPIESWFINLKKIKNKILNLSKNINWCTLKLNLIKKKFENWLKNIKDWNISRNRFWGTPLPIWLSKDKKDLLIIGSIKELIKEINKSIKLGNMKINPFLKYIDNNNNINYNKIDLHKNILDNIILTSLNGKKMYRELDVIDVWFDSGVSSYAQFNYPFKNKKLINKKIIFPSDFICEGIDQTRGWFFTLHVISTIISKNISYKNLLPIGLILDKKGKKMSKSRGNTLNPFKIIKKYGIDYIRWYIIFNNNPIKNLKFNVKDIKKNKFFNTFNNIVNFINNYSKIDNINYKNFKYIRIKFNYIDLWILSKLNKLLFKVNNLYKKYNLTKISRYINKFIIYDLSNWYIRLSRKRFWKNKNDNNKLSAYYTLYKCINKIIKITYPIIPFYMEYINIKLFNNKKKFLITKKFPKYNKKLINKKIEKNIFFIRKYTKIIFFLRKKKNIKVRQPLKKVYIIKNKNNYFLKKNKFILNLFKNEVNIKKVKFININNINKYVNKKIKINYKILGPKFKNKINIIKNKLLKLSQKKIKKFEINKYLYINKKIKLTNKDISIYYENINNNIIMYSNKNTIIILNIKLNKKLKEECLIKDFIRQIQNLRKIKKLKIIDKINIFISIKNYNIFYKIIKKYKKFILNETLTKKIKYYKKKFKNKLYFLNKYKLYYTIKKIY